MIWIETPTNPLLKLADIKAISETIKKTRPDIYVVVDNTFVTCFFQVIIIIMTKNIYNLLKNILL